MGESQIFEDVVVQIFQRLRHCPVGILLAKGRSIRDSCTCGYAIFQSLDTVLLAFCLPVGALKSRYFFNSACRVINILCSWLQSTPVGILLAKGSIKQPRSLIKAMWPYHCPVGILLATAVAVQYSKGLDTVLFACCLPRRALKSRVFFEF